MIYFNEIQKFFPKELDAGKNARNMIKEYLQHLALDAIYNDSLSGPLVFIGGTCLKYFHGIQRFSEDLDFDILPGKDYNKEIHNALLNRIHRRFIREGFKVGYTDGVTANGVLWGRFSFPGLENIMGTTADKRPVVHIKVEARAQGISYQKEQKLLNRFGVFTMVHKMPVEYLFSSKICTTILRGKGRDFYDIVELSAFAKAKEEPVRYILEKNNIKYTSARDVYRLLLKKSGATDWKEKQRELSLFLYNKEDLKKIQYFSEWLEQTDFERIMAG